MDIRWRERATRVSEGDVVHEPGTYPQYPQDRPPLPPNPHPPFTAACFSLRRGGLTTNGLHLSLPLELSNRPGPPQSEPQSPPLPPTSPSTNDPHLRLAKCLGLDESQTDTVLTAQQHGNTATFEDIAVQLHYVDAKTVRYCLRRQGLRGFVRALPAIVPHSIQTLIAACAVFSAIFQIHECTSNRLPQHGFLIVQAVPYYKFSNALNDNDSTYSWQNTTVIVHSDKTKDQTPDLKLVIVVTNIGDNHAPSGCIDASANYLHPTAKTLDTFSFYQLTGITDDDPISLAPKRGYAYITNFNASTVSWNANTSLFNIDCDDTRDPHIIIEFMDHPQHADRPTPP